MTIELRKTWQVAARCSDDFVRIGMLAEYHSSIEQWQIGGMLFDEQDILPLSYNIGDKVALFSSVTNDKDNMKKFKKYQKQPLTTFWIFPATTVKVNFSCSRLANEKLCLIDWVFHLANNLSS